MKKFEYKHAVMGNNVIEKCKELGLEGWDLVSVIPQPSKFLYIFKREL